MTASKNYGIIFCRTFLNAPERITEKCGSLDMIENGDNVMAGRGFESNDLLLHSGDCHISKRNMSYCRARNSYLER